MTDVKKGLASNVDRWEITAARYVAYIDIMGFKDMVARTTHEKMYEMMKKIDERKKSNSGIKWGNSLSNLITTTTYSDSIMIYSKDESFESLFSLICTVSALTNDLFLEGIPHKGAFAFGTMTLDTERSIFFGQPLIDAYLLQEEINFYGIIAHASAEEKVDEFKSLKKSIPFVKNYLCILKNGSSQNLTIYPMFSDHGLASDPKWKSKVDNLSESIKKLRYRTSGHLRKYIDATEIYLNRTRNGEG